MSQAFASQAQQPGPDRSREAVRGAQQHAQGVRREAAAQRVREQLRREGWHFELAAALIGALDRRYTPALAHRPAH